jgi:DNA-binding NarL/FixJ family response regulator
LFTPSKPPAWATPAGRRGGHPAATGREPALQLTSEEAQVARLARDGLSNAEIGSRLFISPRTVEYHLRKVYSKLGIPSRAGLPQIL